LGITAGVMISLSFLELVNEAWTLAGFWTATIGFGAGAFLMLLIDIAIPHIRFAELESQSVEIPAGQNVAKYPHHGRHRDGRIHGTAWIQDQRLFRTGVLLAIGITIHNLPEGLAMGAGYMHTPEFGIMIALAILLHNIPEGVATALPLCKSGVFRWDSFRVALVSGLVEPIGALAAAIFLASFQSLVPAALAFAGGVMMFITLDELIPAAREHGHQHYTAVGIIMGSIFVFLLSGLFGV
jgi:ZIP family zinc transporter